MTRRIPVAVLCSVAAVAAGSLDALGAALAGTASERGTGRWTHVYDGSALQASADGAAIMATMRPVSLTSGDLEEDGVADLIAGFAVGSRGALFLHRGNVDAIYGSSQAARQRQADGTFSDDPFLESR
jgi:hypothetical protein